MGKGLGKIIGYVFVILIIIYLVYTPPVRHAYYDLKNFLEKSKDNISNQTNQSQKEFANLTCDDVYVHFEEEMIGTINQKWGFEILELISGKFYSKDSNMLWCQLNVRISKYRGNTPLYNAQVTLLSNGEIFYNYKLYEIGWARNSR